MRIDHRPEHLAGTLSDAERWARVVARDTAADGTFFYGVRTTGVYCRPSCTSRLPKRENVEFYATMESAERAGFRACKRCRPNGPGLAERQAAAVAKACQVIEAAEVLPNLDRLAAAAGMSRFHFHRVFKAQTGVTPKAYADARRARRLEGELKRSATVTEAIYGSGFNSSGRFYATSSERLGMTPSAYRAGARGKSIRFAIGDCTLGKILVAATEQGICTIAFADDRETLLRELKTRFPHADLRGGDGEFERHVARVIAFVEAPERGLNLPLDVRGTAFQQLVWRTLRQIPPGTTASYSEIAHRIGHPSATRAVARACASNAVAVAIPCHRVVGKGGGLTGYRWGIERKQALLAREAQGRRVGKRSARAGTH
jgi:AraC family transcriptional regulator of adaptative response/methylated-DNA-[protein]-cysteine methyltransferase